MCKIGQLMLFWLLGLSAVIGCSAPGPPAHQNSSVEPLSQANLQQQGRGAAATDQANTFAPSRQRPAEITAGYVQDVPEGRQPPIVQATFIQAAEEEAEAHVAPDPNAEPIGPPTRQEVSPSGVYPIDLPTALRLADTGNYHIAIAREEISQALARVDSSQALWLPSLRAGASYNKHEGALQDASGNVSDISRGAAYAGLGGMASGTGSPFVPGLYANFHLADAIFQPLAARQALCARQMAAAATANDVLWAVSLAYLELLRAAVDVVIAKEACADAHHLAELTDSYAVSGQGLQADADRAHAELAVRQSDILRAREALQVASARLAELLRLDPTITLDPLETTIAPIELVPAETPPRELVAQALDERPELAESKYLVGQAVERMRREKYAPLIPSIVLGASYGTFGGGRGGTLENFDARMDLDAAAFWELKNLGFGTQAARAETRSLLRQANLHQLAVMDRVAREVVEAHAQIQARRQQIAVAKEGVVAAVASQQRNSQRIHNAQGLPIETLQSNQALAQARREYLRALSDYNAAQFSLYRALGSPALRENLALGPAS
jgi:outer membrane protein TolC